MEEVKGKIRETEDKIRQAEADGDKDSLAFHRALLLKLEEYLLKMEEIYLELLRKENLLLSAPPGNPTLPSFSFLSIMI